MIPVIVRAFPGRGRLKSIYKSEIALGRRFLGYLPPDPLRQSQCQYQRMKIIDVGDWILFSIGGRFLDFFWSRAPTQTFTSEQSPKIPLLIDKMYAGMIGS